MLNNLFMKKFLFILPLVLIVSACSGAKEQLGLEQRPPDEFKVVKRAPLEVPPNYTLRPPQPGAPRPQEQATVDQARQTVFGESEQGLYESRTPSTEEGMLLQQAGAEQADPNIRRQVDSETANWVDENQPVIDKLMNLGGDDQAPASVVDAKKEAERIQKARQEGESIVIGETPAKEQ